MAKQVNDRLQEKMALIQQPRSNINRLFSEDTEYKPLLKELKGGINYYDNQSEEEIRILLRRSYAKYHFYYQSQARVLIRLF